MGKAGVYKAGGRASDLGVWIAGITAGPLCACVGFAFDPKSARRRSESWMCARALVRGVLQVGSGASVGGAGQQGSERAAEQRVRAGIAGGGRGRS